MQQRRFSVIPTIWLLCLIASGLFSTSLPGFADHRHGQQHTSKPFHGVKVNAGTITYSQDGDRNLLTLSDDFQLPDAPAPHWQIVDSRGNIYLLERLKIKGDKINKQITVPAYIRDIAKVQIWCAWAETLLGETTFDTALPLDTRPTTTTDVHTSTQFAGVKANTGTVTHAKQDGQNILTLSDDFKFPDAPAPHWQIVDSSGRVYLLQRLVIKGEQFHKSIVVPSYIPDIAKVQIWCAWAQVLLGEATFDSPIKTQ